MFFPRHAPNSLQSVGGRPTESRTSVFFNFLLQWNLLEMFALHMEPYAMTQVSIFLQPHRTVVAYFAPGNFGLFRRQPLAATYMTPVEKH